MKIRGLLVAVAVLAVLGGAIWWSSKTKEADATKASADTAPKLISIPQDQLKRIEIRKSAGETIALDQPAPGKWEMTAPKPLPLDHDAVSSLASSFSSLSADRVVEDKASDLSAYGLTKPSLDVSVTAKNGKTQNLLIGDETPTSGAFFAKLQNDPRVFTVASFTKTSLDKSPNDLRDKRLLTFDSDKLARLELDEKNQAIEFAKNNQNDWQILKPKPLRADGGQVEELIRKLKDAKMDLSGSADDEKKVTAAFAAGAPVATVKVTDAGGTQQLQIKKDKKENNYYAKSSVVEGVHKVGSDLGEALNKDLDSFRNKKVFDFGWSDPSKVEYHEGAKQAVYTKSGEKWTAGGKQMDSPSVQALIDKLRDLAAAKFDDKGFANPAIDITVVSNDGKKTDKVALAKQGTAWLAKRENEPSIYVLDTPAVEALQKAASEVKEAAPPQAKKK